jgi:protein-L-isoaspartate O-methyltransferase
MRASKLKSSMLHKILYYRPRLEAAVSALDKVRLRLPLIDLHLLFDDFDSVPVTLTDLPIGPWSTPIADLVILAKIALCIRPKRVLEVGSFRGHTAKLLAEHTGPNTTIVTLDRDDRHGIAYRDTPLAAKIERRVGEVNSTAFTADTHKSYDLIFLDADHTYLAVKHDTEVLLPLLAPGGIMVWHDYANWGRFSRKNGVPEALHELAQTRPVAAVGGSWLAAHSPAWASGAGAERFAKAQQPSSRSLLADPWTTGDFRG